MTDTIEFESVTHKLLAETALIRWHDLQRFFAQGAVLNVSSELNLVEVASLFAEDKAAELEPLLSQQLIQQPDNQLARQWYDDDVELWSVVVAPYILVQDKPAPKSISK